MIATVFKNKRTNWTTSEIPNLEGKTVLITGSNSGLGYYTTRISHTLRKQEIIIIVKKDTNSFC